MKTYKGWQKSNLDLDKYLVEPCRIDEELYNYIAETVPPQYLNESIVQLGEAQYSDSYGDLYYLTAAIFEGKYFYIGCLPEFKQ